MNFVFVLFFYGRNLIHETLINRNFNRKIAMTEIEMAFAMAITFNAFNTLILFDFDSSLIGPISGD